MKSRHLFVTDLDGTLLGPDSRVSQRSARIISHLVRHGALVTVATARTPATVEPLLADTDISLPAIVMTGAALWDRSRKRYIDPIFIPEAGLAKAMEAFRNAGVSPFVYRLDKAGALTVGHSPEMSEGEKRFYEERSHLTLKRFVFDYSGEFAADASAVILLYAIGEASVIEPVAKVLGDEKTLSVSCYRDIFNTSVANLEIFGSGVSKAAAIERVAEMVGADVITVYGDNLNDLPMFAVADDAVPVANAVGAVKEAASRVIGLNGPDSVALDMQRISDGELHLRQTSYGDPFL